MGRWIRNAITSSLLPGGVNSSTLLHFTIFTCSLPTITSLVSGYFCPCCFFWWTHFIFTRMPPSYCCLLSFKLSHYLILYNIFLNSLDVIWDSSLIGVYSEIPLVDCSHNFSSECLWAKLRKKLEQENCFLRPYVFTRYAKYLG